MAELESDTAAFSQEALTHLDTLYRGALRLTRDPDRAQDLVQDTYVRAFRYQHSYQPGTNMKAWLFAIMRNLFWDCFKGGRQEDLRRVQGAAGGVRRPRAHGRGGAGGQAPPGVLPAVRGALQLPGRFQALGQGLLRAGQGPGRPAREATEDPLLRERQPSQFL